MDERQGRVLQFNGLRALVVGLAREGRTLARFLAERGAQVTVTDTQSAAALADSIAALEGWPIQYALGGHPLALLDGIDIIFVSPGVPLEVALLVEARRRGLPLSSETRLFARLCPAPIVGITGSSGKTTTTALVGEMLKASSCKTWVGGNIGKPLLGHLDEIAATDLVVIELSSFQLEFFAPWPLGRAGSLRSELLQGSAVFDPAGCSPHIAAVLNITPNHLDRHPSMEAYVAAKAHILGYQRPGDVAVLNFDNPETRRMGQACHTQHVVWFSMENRVQEGAFLRGDELRLRLAGHEYAVCRIGEVQLLGEHNVANILAACAASAAGGASVEAMRQAAITFSGVEHRLELVHERRGVRWYNDSIATTPERTVAALRAFEAPVVLLAGGRDKHLPWEEMAALTWKKVRHLILFGEAAELIATAMHDPSLESSGPCHIHQAGSLERAVELASRLAQPGDVVLLSPGGTSFDNYQDFGKRGEHFRQLVRGLE